MGKVTLHMFENQTAGDLLDMRTHRHISLHLMQFPFSLAIYIFTLDPIGVCREDEEPKITILTYFFFNF